MGQEKLFDTSVKFTYEEVEDAVDYVLDYINRNGPYDALFGFSQGCIIIHLIAAILRERGLPVPWKFSALFCGMKVRDNRFAELFDVPLRVPCVQVYGRQDPYYDYGRRSQPLMYEDPLILEHDEG